MIAMKRLLILAASVAALAIPVAAQPSHYDVQTINFDLWCQETQHLPADRCDKRLPRDETDFEAYRARVEKYELKYLQGKENGAQLDRTILHNDPVDHPVTQDPSAAAQQATSPTTRPQP